MIKYLTITGTQHMETNKNKRYYLHGDRSEENPELYFCHACDVFLPAEHFQAPCRRCKDHMARYRYSVKALDNEIKIGSGYTRPPGSYNLFT